MENTEPFRYFAHPPLRPTALISVRGHMRALVTHPHAGHCGRGLLVRIPPGEVAGALTPGSTAEAAVVPSTP